MEIVEPEKKREFETVLPLVNIVFLLLIFFMLAGAFTKPDIFDVKVPEASVDKEADLNEITILMNANSELAIETTPYSEDELIELLNNKLSEKELTVQLKADEKVKSQDLIAIMESLGKTDLKSIRLLTVAADDTQ